MPYRRWVIDQKLSRRRKNARDKVFERIERVVMSSLTQKKQLSDFPAVDKYLGLKFPDVDLSVVKLYLASPKVMEKSGWADIGGCYIRDKRTILVKDDINHRYKAKGKFQRLMRSTCRMVADVEDVVIHEFIHAVSDLIGRALSKYRHMEEEFVYTNCIDFYRQKGMDDESIVNNNFLPFCLQDVFESPKELLSVFAQIDKTIDIHNISEERYQKLLNTNADDLVPLFKKKAQEKAHKMIELYHKYGAQMHKTSSVKTTEDMRFSSLDLE